MSEAGHNIAGSLQSFTDRIMRLEEQIKELNGDKSQVYKDASNVGFDLPALRKTIRAYRELTGEQRVRFAERDALAEVYLNELMNKGEEPAPHARTPARASAAKPSQEPIVIPPHNSETGEILTPPDPNDPGDIPPFLRRERAA